MNKLLLSAGLAATLLFASCQGESTANSQEEPAVTTENVEAITSISFEEEVFDFGSITQGEKVEHTFKFRNNGENDLVIVSAKGSCGCTVPKWPKEPIAPGEEGDIHVVFNSEGKKGMQHKKVSIIANTEPATTVIALKGEVIAPDEPLAPAGSGEETGTDQSSEG